MIRKTTDSREHLVFQHTLKEQLHERGFSGTDRYYPALDGFPFFEYGNSIYVMTEFPKHQESDFGNKSDLTKVLRQVAMFHNAARNLVFDEPFYGNENILNIYRKQAAEIDGIKKLIGQRSRLSDFDVIFLKNYNGYRRLMNESMEILEQTKLTQFKSNAKDENAVCHNLLKEEHLLIVGDSVNIIGFSQAAVDYFVFDLCTVIQRYSKRQGTAHMNINDILELYDKHRALTGDDVEILLGLLKYPTKFVKICRQYYSKKRTWTPSAIINRLEGIVEGKVHYDKFVEGLKSKVGCAHNPRNS